MRIIRIGRKSRKLRPYTELVYTVLRHRIVLFRDFFIIGHFSTALHFFRYSPSRRAAITAQSHNLLQDFRILQNLVLNDSSHRAEEIDTKIFKSQKFSSKLWLCAVMASRLLGRVTEFLRLRTKHVRCYFSHSNPYSSS